MTQQKESWEEELTNLERKTDRGMYWVRLDMVRDIIHESLSNREREIADEVEKLIQEERYSGAPYALNKLLSLLKP